jgi:hypothetical protein
LVHDKSESEFSPIRNFAIQKMSKWIRAEKISLIRDPTISEVEQVWPQNNNILVDIDGVKLYWLQHYQLLYTYRNSLIHEFRAPGHHAELWDVDEPYYTYVISDKGDNSGGLERTWGLQYTAKFFRRLCVNGLSNLEKHFLQNGIDPFNSIDWGSYWIRELNL